MKSTKSTLSSEECSISPNMARELLEKNTMNRPLKSSVVQRYAEIMNRDEWLLTGEPILFSSSGKLLNGQHRLHSIILSGQTIRALIVRGVEESAFHALDQGSRRLVSDVLAIGGEKNTTKLAGATRVAWALSTYPGSKSAVSRFPTVDQALDTLAKYPVLRDFTSLIGAKNSRLIEPSILIGVTALCAEKNHEQAEKIILSLLHGEGLVKGHPIYTLRERLIAIKADKTNRADRSVLTAYLIKAWNATRAGKQMHICRLSPDESYPTIE